uniref:Eukaryotic translation initiation factor 4E binding protein 1 n=1 Tax=Calidris pygmaea TaxID=425635 RepID=A0A8C3PLY4_9CHAR
MSGRCCQEQTPSRDIPGPGKRLALPDGAPLPPGDYSTTPGGTVFGTTPGGTRIIYDRVTSPNVEELKIENNHVQNCDEKVSAGECTQKPKRRASLGAGNRDRYIRTGARRSPGAASLQNHRMIWGWKGPLEIIQSNPPARAGPTGMCPGGFECLQRRRLHHLPGQPLLGLCHPHRKEVPPHV